ncbi:MAG: hypothetical protein LUD46_19140 [Parabacteroides sp.]|nr:hypothetical protein [Parabacteroides sp.]
MHEVKQLELFLLLRGFYKKEELANLFYSIIGQSIDFRSLVMENYLKVDHVDELAQIARMGRTNFNNKFVKSLAHLPTNGF